MSRVTINRTWDHPVDGFAVRGSTVLAFVHQNVHEIAHRDGWATQNSGSLVSHALDRALLYTLSKSARSSLPGC